MSKEKESWIFTFGCGQKHAHTYVRIYGTFGEARTKMFEKYGEEWSMQYTEEEWADWEKRRPLYLKAETLLETIY